MSKIPVTTEERIALVAKGNLGSEDASQFMNEMFDSPDYLPTLLGYSGPQQFIDGLYEVFNYYLYEYRFDLGPTDLLPRVP